MNFSQMQSFLAAAKYENFTRAAEHLYISQPVLSRHISTMEDELGIRLFCREKRSVQLTPAGKVLYDGFSRLIRDYNVTVDKALAMQKENVNTFNIGFVEGLLFTRPFAAPVQAFRAANPEARTNLMRYSIQGLKEAVLSGEVDVALTAKYKNIEDESELCYIKIGSTPIAIVMPVNHPLAEKEVLRTEDLQGETIITLSKHESLVETAESSELFAGIEHKEIVMPDISAFALAIEAGYGIATINSNHSLLNNPNLRFVPTEGIPDFTETVVWRHDNSNPAIKLFLKECQPVAD